MRHLLSLKNKSNLIALDLVVEYDPTSFRINNKKSASLSVTV